MEIFLWAPDLIHTVGNESERQWDGRTVGSKISSTAAELLSLSPRTVPLEEARDCCVYPRSYYFGHFPQFTAIGEGRDADWLVNQQLCLHSQPSLCNNRLVQRLLRCRCCTAQSACQSHTPFLLHIWTPPLEAVTQPRLVAGSPPFSWSEPWPETRKSSFSSVPLHTRFQTASLQAGGRRLMNPAGLGRNICV